MSPPFHVCSGQYIVQFDNAELGVLQVRDTSIFPHGHVPLLYPALCPMPDPSRPRAREARTAIKPFTPHDPWVLGNDGTEPLPTAATVAAPASARERDHFVGRVGSTATYDAHTGAGAAVLGEAGAGAGAGAGVGAGAGAPSLPHAGMDAPHVHTHAAAVARAEQLAATGTHDVTAGLATTRSTCCVLDSCCRSALLPV